MRVPEALRRRLLDAAAINALTEIEEVIVELKQLDPAAQRLAGELDAAAFSVTTWTAS